MNCTKYTHFFLQCLTNAGYLISSWPITLKSKLIPSSSNYKYIWNWPWNKNVGWDFVCLEVKQSEYELSHLLLSGAKSYEGMELYLHSSYVHILNLCTTWRWVVSFTLWPLYSWGKYFQYPLDRGLHGLQSQTGWGGKRESLPLLEIELWLLAHSQSVYWLSSPRSP